MASIKKFDKSASWGFYLQHRQNSRNQEIINISTVSIDNSKPPIRSTSGPNIIYCSGCVKWGHSILIGKDV